MANHSQASVRKARETSLQVKEARVHRDMLDMTGVSVDTFMFRLDTWLIKIPDHPTIQGRQRAAITNSIIDQVVVNH
jgi:hypothetical protein